MVLLNTTPELMRSISSEIESQFFLNGYDICVVPYARKGKEIPPPWSIIFVPQTWSLVRKYRLEEKALAIA